MSRITMKKRALIVAAVTSLTLVAVAIAYYTTAGDGSGAGANATEYAADLVITNDDADGVVPGSTGAIAINGDIANNNEGSAKVSNLQGVVTNVTGETAGTCDPTWFHITGEDVTDSDDVIESGASSAFTATLSMDDLPLVDQNPCKGADLVIDWSSDAS